MRRPARFPDFAVFPPERRESIDDFGRLRLVVVDFQSFGRPLHLFADCAHAFQYALLPARSQPLCALDPSPILRPPVFAKVQRACTDCIGDSFGAATELLPQLEGARLSP